MLLLLLALAGVVAGIAFWVRSNGANRSVDGARATTEGTVKPLGDTAAAAPAPVVYDPTKLVENKVPAGEVFAKEPRSANWAESVEAVIGGAMSRDLAALIPDATVVVTCKTLSCLVGVDAPADKRAAAVAITQFLTLAPWVVDMQAEKDGTQLWLFFQEPRFADPAVFLPWYSATRRRKLADIRSGKSPNPFPVPPAQIPHE